MLNPNFQLEPCRPPLWAKPSHINTITAYFLPSAQAGPYHEMIHTPVSGGDQITTLYYPGSKPISVYLFHGLSGSTKSSYMQRTGVLARTLGAHVYMTNHRGCGEGAGLAREPYHSGRSDDMSAVIAEGRKRNPNHLHVAIGFSLSGNAVLLLAAGVRAPVLPDYVISVNPPIHLAKCAQHLVTGLNRIYDQKFMSELRRDYEDRVERKYFDGPPLPRFMTTYDFDAIYTGKAAGFGTREKYYETCSAAQFLPDIKVPTFMMTAEDDPFIPVEDFFESRRSEKVKMHIEKYGGHLGYLNNKNLPVGGKRWLDYALHNILSDLLKNI